MKDTQKMTSASNPIISEHLSGNNLSHGFFSRSGGVSSGIYRGLNVGLGSKDNRDHVLENRRRVADALAVGPEALTTPYQIHSADVLEVHEPWPNGHRPKVDALATKTPGIAVGILSADCGPVLFADAENGVVAAAHAGWKGAIGGVLENTISAMETLGAERSNITAVLGPTISQENYEVGPEFVSRLTDASGKNRKYFEPSPNDGHALFDLPSFIVDRLIADGISASWSGHCTYANEELFFSYRRTTHRKEADYGRQVSAIKLEE